MNHDDYFRTHPPRCVAGFDVRLVELPGVFFNGHACPDDQPIDLPPGVTIEEPDYSFPIFRVACPCGGDSFSVHGYRWFNEYYKEMVFLSPIELECRACGKLALLFDSDQHGYDAEHEHGSITMRAAGDPAVFACPTCGPQSLEVFIRFEQSHDAFIYHDPEFSGREQDLFSWVNIVGTCPGCSRLLQIADYECA